MFRINLKFFPAVLFVVFSFMTATSEAQTQDRPNILWIVSEDNSLFSGADGDDFATTPNMDQLAAEGFLDTSAHANAPVCAPARNTIITGVYANSNGNQHMRSNYKVSDIIRFFPQYLREAGYYATNNSKEDYNIATGQTREIWDESSGEAHYRNREPGQRLDYLWRAPSMQSWEEACEKGECNDKQRMFWNTKPVEELYDTQNDPWEVKNLAGNPENREVLERMRKANREWIINFRDTGFIPEAELTARSGNQSIYDYMRSGDFSLKENIEAADTATLASENNIPQLRSYMESCDSAIRYWGATGFLILGEAARPSIPELKKMLDDPSPNVVTVASEALYNLGVKDRARYGFKKTLQTSSQFARTHVLNTIDSVNENTAEIQQAVIRMAQQAEELTRQYYDHRAAMILFDKWEIQAEDHGIEVSWLTIDKIIGVSYNALSIKK